MEYIDHKRYTHERYQQRSSSMKTHEDPAVRRWARRLEMLGVTVPAELNPSAMKQLLDSTSGNEQQQHAAVHLALHFHSAQLCRGQQIGEADEQPRQATQ